MFSVFPIKQLVTCLFVIKCITLLSCTNFESETLFQSQSKTPIKYGVYKVQKGDSLYSIAWRFKRDYRELGRINNIKEPYVIYVGQVIKLAGYEDEIPSKSGYTGQTIIEPRPESKSGSEFEAKSVRISRNAPEKKSNNYQSSNKKMIQKNTSSNNKLKWQWPASGKIIQNFSSSSVGKKGIQIAGNAGDPVKAAAEGQVVYSGNSLVGYGNLVIVKHNEKYLTAYAHNRRVLVKEGEHVTQGQTIAEMGASGTDRNKLHFEIRQDGQPVNPTAYLPSR